VFGLDDDPVVGSMWVNNAPSLVGGADYVLLGRLQNTDGTAAYALVCECDTHPVQ